MNFFKLRSEENFYLIHNLNSYLVEVEEDSVTGSYSEMYVFSKKQWYNFLLIILMANIK